MKKLFIPAFALVIAFAGSAFTAKKTSGSFYRYTSTSHAKVDIQNINNYVRDENGCDDGSDVCGVTLPTDEGAGNQPDATEFSSESTNLWNSQSSGTAQDSNVIMKD